MTPIVSHLLGGRLEGKVRARKHLWKIYGVERCVVDVYSRRMHQRQLPGLKRDRKRALADLVHPQEMLERQRQRLRANALLVVLALVLVKVVKRRLRKARVKVRSVASLLSALKRIQRARFHLGEEAPPAVRAFAETIWVPSERTQNQTRILKALGLDTRAELGTTLILAKTQAGRAKRTKISA